MTSAEAIRIQNTPAFQELARKRTSFGWTLAAIMFVCYMVFVFLMAFGRDFVAQPIDGVITLAFPIGLGIIALAIILTGVYVVRANGEFDRLTRQIVGQATPTVIPLVPGLVGGVR